MWQIYNIFISLMVLGLKIASYFNEKAKKGVGGRSESFVKIKSLKGKKVIWMHAASLGEYEQGLPVLQELKKNYPRHKILLTFFSPSGYENIVKKQCIADVVCYLPFDFKEDIQRFIENFQTDIFFTIKYDYWYHLLAELKKRGTKIFVVSALFYEKQIFFKSYGKWFVKQLKSNVDYFFHQNEYSDKLAKSIGLKQSVVSGDTRFDRVKQIREQDNFVPLIKEFKGNKPLVIFGSSWESEEKIAKMLLEKSLDIKVIIAPHDIKRTLNLGNNPLLKYSELHKINVNTLSSANLLVIDSIGLLSKLYSYADIAVVGGGFHSAGLHNILEAATFGKPVIFGNHYKKNPEADLLITQNGGKALATEKEAVDFILELINDKNKMFRMSQNAGIFIHSQPNATECIIKKMII